MAIVIEEESKGGINIIGVLLWVAFLAGLAIGGYYIFFTKPELVEVAVPNDFKNAEQISKLELNPEEVLNNPQFRALRTYVTLPLSPATGRNNPFSHD